MYVGELHYVEMAFREIGIPCNSYRVMEIKQRNMPEIEIPEECIGIRFFDLFLYDEGDEELKGTKRRNESGWIYFGKEYTIDEIKAQFPEKKVWITEMENNGWKRVAVLESGGVQYLEENDKAVLRR